MKRILKLLLVAMGLIMFVPSFTSCKDKEKEEESEYAKSGIVGTWKYTDGEEYELIQFKSDGTFVLISKYYNGDDYDSETTSFTYVINGSTLVSKCDLCGEITDHTFVISGNILYMEGKEYYRQ